MSFEESETEESTSSLSDVSSLDDDDFVRMDLESGNSDEETTGHEVDSQDWDEIQSESDAEFMEDYMDSFKR